MIRNGAVTFLREEHWARFEYHTRFRSLGMYVGLSVLLTQDIDETPPSDDTRGR